MNRTIARAVLAALLVAVTAGLGQGVGSSAPAKPPSFSLCAKTPGSFKDYKVGGLTVGVAYRTQPGQLVTLGAYRYKTGTTGGGDWTQTFPQKLQHKVSGTGCVLMLLPFLCGFGQIDVVKPTYSLPGTLLHADAVNAFLTGNYLGGIEPD